MRCGLLELFLLYGKLEDFKPMLSRFLPLKALLPKHIRQEIPPSREKVTTQDQRLFKTPTVI